MRAPSASRLGLDHRVQTRTKPVTLNAQVLLNELDFLRNAKFRSIQTLQRRPEKAAQGIDHGRSGHGVSFPDQGRNAVQRVEQEMRVQIRLQGTKTSRVGQFECIDDIGALRFELKHRVDAEIEGCPRKEDDGVKGPKV